MTHGSLFSGIGGFDLAAEWMGWTNVFHCEKNPFGQRVLKHYWPNAISYDDITTTDFTIHRGNIDILTGGFPCQPFSAAGKRKGTEDDRHLWPQMLRAIREIQPRYVVGENVRGLTNWNGGLVFDQVQADLEAEGFEVLPFLLPACAVNAPHRRDRIWFVAHATFNTKYNEAGNERSYAQTVSPQRFNERVTTSNSDEVGFSDTQSIGKLGGKFRFAIGNQPYTWEKFPNQHPVCNGNDGLSLRLDGISFPKWREQTLMAAGNALVPRVALQLFKAIEETEMKLSA